jgi:hypothetical protein
MPTITMYECCSCTPLEYCNGCYSDVSARDARSCNACQKTFCVRDLDRKGYCDNCAFMISESGMGGWSDEEGEDEEEDDTGCEIIVFPNGKEGYVVHLGGNK